MPAIAPPPGAVVKGFSIMCMGYLEYKKLVKTPLGNNRDGRALL